MDGAGGEKTEECNLSLHHFWIEGVGVSCLFLRNGKQIGQVFAQGFGHAPGIREKHALGFPCVGRSAADLGLSSGQTFWANSPLPHPRASARRSTSATKERSNNSGDVVMVVILPFSDPVHGTARERISRHLSRWPSPGKRGSVERPLIGMDHDGLDFFTFVAVAYRG